MLSPGDSAGSRAPTPDNWPTFQQLADPECPKREKERRAKNQRQRQTDFQEWHKRFLEQHNTPTHSGSESDIPNELPSPVRKVKTEIV